MVNGIKLQESLVKGATVFQDFSMEGSESGLGIEGKEGHQQVGRRKSNPGRWTKTGESLDVVQERKTDLFGEGVLSLRIRRCHQGTGERGQGVVEILQPHLSHRTIWEKAEAFRAGFWCKGTNMYRDEFVGCTCVGWNMREKK